MIRSVPGVPLKVATRSAHRPAQAISRPASRSPPVVPRTRPSGVSRIERTSVARWIDPPALRTSPAKAAATAR